MTKLQKLFIAGFTITGGVLGGLLANFLLPILKSGTIVLFRDKIEFIGGSAALFAIVALYLSAYVLDLIESRKSKD